MIVGHCLPPGIEHSYVENSIPDSGKSSCLDFLNGCGKDVGMSDWPYSQAGSGFQLFGEDSDVSDVLIDLDFGAFSGHMLCTYEWLHISFKVNHEL